MSYNLMFNKAIELQNNGALNEAESIYLQLLQLTPENADLWNLLGLIAQSKADFQRAIDCFLKAVKYAPTPFALHYFNLGLSYKALNLRKEADEALKKCLDLNPNLKEGWLFYGLLSAENGASTEAVKCFCKALDLDVHYTEARAYLCYYTNDKTTLKQTADEESSNFTANFLAGKMFEDETYLQQALTVDPYNVEGLTFYAKYLTQHNRLEEARKLYHRVLCVDENNLEAILGIADIELASGNDDKAELYYKKSFTLSREIAGAYLNYGILLYRQHRLSEALEAYRQAVILAPDIPEISYNLALVLKETEEYEEALGLMFNAHQKNPAKEEFTINIMETLSELYTHNAELALKIAENWQKIEPDNVFSKHILGGLSGAKDLGDEVLYAEKLFDVFADTYDETLEKLNPQIITKFKELNPHLNGRILDLGCGTGAAAEALNTDKTIFDGVDISAQMLQKATQKKLYQTLIKEDILTYICSHPIKETYDTVLAFDVFCYLGNLEPVLKALKGCSLWFSLETADKERASDYYLTPNGRYKHQTEYVIRISQKLGFKQIKSYPLVLRKEKNEDVAGTLFHIYG